MSTIDENALKAGARAIRLNYDAEYEEDASDWWCDRLARAAITAYLTATSDAQAERVRELEGALRGLVADVADYPAWQRPCHALDVARAALRGEA